MVGPYRLKEIIGEGGFGTVWLAEQKEPIARRVALKIIKPGMDSKEVIARFEQERQALALMDHPNIARVHDAGTTPAGRPYFAMEFVKGAPITDYCDRSRLTIAQRLYLFSSVCDGVQHAHMKGIIHRDLKPSNILVAAPDAASARQGADHTGLPSVKIIDFGVAKALASKLTEKTIFTERGQLIGTPEYMSPEQAEMAETDIDTRSDVYALGVILYELLAGALPFDPKTLRSGGYAAIQKTIREVDPPRPSTRLSQMSDVVGGMSESGAPGAPSQPTPHISHPTSTMTGIADRRRSTLPDLLRTLRSELEWIPLKAMRKDRAERYRTASELGDDIANYLADRPLIAGPESTTYKVKKFIRRNRAGVAAGAMVFAALILGLAGTAWQYRAAAIERDAAREAERQQAILREKSEQLAASEAALRAASESSEKRAKQEAAEAQRQRDAAEKSRRESELTAKFMSDMLQGAGPSVAKGRDITMLREMMDAAAARIEKGDLKDAPEAELRLRRTIGSTYRELAVFDAAEKMLAPAAAMARTTHAGDHAEAATALNELAVLLQARGDLAGAEGLYRESLEMRKRLYTGDHPQVAASLNNLASLLHDRGDFAAAEPLYREAADMWSRMSPGDNASAATAMANLATLLQDRGDLAGAEPLSRQSLEMRRRLFPGDHPDVAVGLNNRALLLLERGDLAEAESLYRESLEMRKRLYPGDSPEVAAGLGALAAALRSRGDLAGAEPLLRESLGMWRRLFPGDHEAVVNGCSNLGFLLEARGDLLGAEPLIREAAEMNGRLLGEEHPDALLSRYYLGNLLITAGRYADAVPVVEACAAGCSKAFGATHENTRRAIGMAVTLYEAWHQAEPGKGYDVKAAEWKAKLDAVTPPAAEPKPADKK